jgi:OOP family OmpA-OmpF porin
MQKDRYEADRCQLCDVYDIANKRRRPQVPGVGIWRVAEYGFAVLFSNFSSNHKVKIFDPRLAFIETRLSISFKPWETSIFISVERRKTMKFKFALTAIGSVLMIGLFTAQVMAAEILTVEDFRQKVVSEENLVKTADNAIFMFDGSSSMGKMFKDTNTSKVRILKEFLQARNVYFPNLGYNFGLYQYAPKFKEIYAVQPYDRQRFADALNQLPSEASGPTLLQQGLYKIEPALQGLSGRTVVFLISDGEYRTYKGFKDPVLKAQEYADKYNVCFNIISTADTEKAENFLQEMASVNQCSRVIPFETYIGRPEYNSGALYVVKSGTKLVTLSDQKVVGLKTDNIQFAWDVSDIDPVFHSELDQIGSFMQSHPQAFAVIDGYADNTGTVDYNLRLSRQRAEGVGNYLSNKFGISSDRLVILWYGHANPIASNDNDAGRALNRRVEIAIGGMK